MIVKTILKPCLVFFSYCDTRLIFHFLAIVQLFSPSFFNGVLQNELTLARKIYIFSDSRNILLVRFGVAATWTNFSLFPPHVYGFESLDIAEDTKAIYAISDSGPTAHLLKYMLKGELCMVIPN